MLLTAQSRLFFLQEDARSPSRLCPFLSLLFVVFIGLHNPLHDFVANHIAIGSIQKSIPAMSLKILSRTDDGRGLLPLGKGHLVMSPVTTALEPNPMRVRNIFICSAWCSALHRE
jgi:hypothetical protein